MEINLWDWLNFKHYTVNYPFRNGFSEGLAVELELFMLYIPNMCFLTWCVWDLIIVVALAQAIQLLGKFF